MYVLTVNGFPVRKSHTARDAWAEDAVAGHPTDGEGICVREDGTTLEVREYDHGTDVWRVESGISRSFYYGTAREMRKAYGFFQRADRLEWEGWITVYGS